jgi:hypothetical protein
MKIAKKYNIKASNVYTKHTPLWLKKTADIILGLILVIDTSMLTIPDFHGKEWIAWGCTTFGLLFKFATKSITEEEQPQ